MEPKTNIVGSYDPGMLDHVFSDADRERHALMVEIQKMYQPTVRDVELENRFKRMIEVVHRHDLAKARGETFVVGRLAEARCLWVVGNPGVGKTRSLQRAFIQKFPDYGKRGVYCPLVTVNAQSPFTLAEFAKRIIAAATGLEPERDFNEKAAWRVARAAMSGRVRFLHIDEAQNFMETNNPVEMTRGRNAIRSLLQDLNWPVSLIFSGTPASLKLGNGDVQVGRRRDVVHFEDMDATRFLPILAEMLASYCAKAKLASHEELDDSFLERLMHAAWSRFGVAVEYMHDALDEALQQKTSQLRVEHFALAYAARSGCAPDSNVFTMGDWRGENVSLASLRLKPEGSVQGKAPAKQERKQ
jgi:hypothetical protein